MNLENKLETLSNGKYLQSALISNLLTLGVPKHQIKLCCFNVVESCFNVDCQHRKNCKLTIFLDSINVGKKVLTTLLNQIKM